MSKQRFYTSFTLLELLIVIGILAVLASVSFIALNPVEQLRKARDSQRLADLRSLNNSLAIYESQTLNPVMGSSTLIYVSLPDTNSNCSSWSLPAVPPDYSGYACVTETNLRKTNGTGWVPVNLAGLEIGSPLAKLPVDPKNDSTYYYTYTTGGSFMLSGLMESTNNKVADQAINDGGRMPGVFELGSNLNLGPFTRDNGLVGYWTFDEGTGTTAYDYSGNNNTGTLTNGPTWQTSTNCKKGGCLSFDGVDDKVSISDSSSLHFGINNISLAFWMKNISSPLSNLIQKGNFNRFWATYSPNIIRINSYFGSGKDYWLDSNINVNDGGYHFIVATYDRNGYEKIYIDGSFNQQMNISGAAGISWDSSSSLLISPGTYGYFNGSIDDVRIYNRALSEAEIQAIYNATK
ncbi:MAG: LamG-like jellyroll fold domain-containing protein [Patescibacteria group bacterium]